MTNDQQDFDTVFWLQAKAVRLNDGRPAFNTELVNVAMSELDHAQSVKEVKEAIGLPTEPTDEAMDALWEETMREED